MKGCVVLLFVASVVAAVTAQARVPMPSMAGMGAGQNGRRNDGIGARGGGMRQMGGMGRMRRASENYWKEDEAHDRNRRQSSDKSTGTAALGYGGCYDNGHGGHGGHGGHDEWDDGWGHGSWSSKIQDKKS
ncbi:cold and drought-regulated protein CORA [Fopius arisanus]|uniref:Cold and drought-regulated protein CORA n=2 Tax=Fopius arisanus TaxID=64838 RepID=A0A9R1T2H8_9HYME|nr:PREDICTED: cold and drought-regulated protein CORA-like [Fopius arisanus]